MTIRGWLASSYYARTRNSAWTVASMLFLACALLGALSIRAHAQAPNVEKALSSSKKADRLTAADQVRRGRGAASPAALKGALGREKDGLVRARLLQGVAAQSGAGAVGELIASLDRDASVFARQAAAQELGPYAAQPEAAAALAAALRKDTAPEVRYACASSLALAKGPVAVEALDWASRHGDPDLRRQAAFSLRRHAGAEAKKILKRLEGDGDASVRKEAKVK